VRFAPEVQAELLKSCFTDRWDQKRPEAASVSELRRFIEEAILLDLKKAAFDTEDAALIPDAGACTECPKRTGNDRMLFGDVKQGDRCSDPVCFARKLERTVAGRIEALGTRGKKAVRISGSYNRTPALPKDALTTREYDRIANGKTCDDTAFGVFVDGTEKGRQIRVCANAKCAVHGFAPGQARGSAQDKEKRAKARVEALTRWRVFQAIFEASSKVQLQDEDYLRVVEFAIWRADHNGLMRTAKVVGWDKELFSYGGRAKLREQLGKVDFDQAMAVALLASVSSELTVSEHNSAKAEHPKALARSFKVDTGAIRRQVVEEVAGKRKGGGEGRGERGVTIVASLMVLLDRCCQGLARILAASLAAEVNDCNTGYRRLDHYTPVAYHSL